jgi:hypothetical protein
VHYGPISQKFTDFFLKLYFVLIIHHFIFYRLSTNLASKIPKKSFRYAVYQNACKIIDAHNTKHKAGKVSFTLGLNKYATLTAAEIKARNGFKAHKRYQIISQSGFEIKMSAIPISNPLFHKNDKMIL